VCRTQAGVPSTYDRAGLAWSDSGPANDTVEQTIADLHTLLRAAGEKGPYLLVGASIGGIYIRARLDFLSSNTLSITAKGSGHEIHLFQPDVLVQALLRAVPAVRNRVPLSRS
jgi:hypothetical protein